METRLPQPEVALLVDPDPRCAESVRASVRDLTVEIVAVDSLAAALEQVAKEAPRLILSELKLPDGSGFGLCRRVRESEATAELPILLLSDWTSESDRILAFECGADDFLAKPFFERELGSRIRAILRRSHAVATPPTEHVPAAPTHRIPLDIDEGRREVRFRGQRVALTPLEFSLLATLARHQGRVLSRRDLIAEAWNPGEYPTERSVDAHVKSLRRKLGQAKDVIETVRGLGYRFSEAALAPRPLARG